MNRRESLKLIAVASLAGAFPACRPSDVERAASRVAGDASTQPPVDREPTVLNEHEYRTIHVLVDYIIPADDRSGSASDAGVPAFIDFLLEDVRELEAPVRGGLAWLDMFARDTHGATFKELGEPEQRSTLDAIAYPEESPPGLTAGVEFFTRLRNLTASGFFSSKLGVEDLGYTGNTAHAEWDGCPDEAHRHLGLG